MKKISVALFMLLVAGPSVAAVCPKIPPAPRTIIDTAENYSKSSGFSLNGDGILQYDYGAHHGGQGKWANPFFVSDYALALYRDWLNSQCEDNDLKEKFLLQASWLASVAKIDGEIASWPFPFRDNNFDLDPGWISGIGQSRIAAVLLRADAIKFDPKLHDIALKALHAYDVPIDKGGVVTIDNDVTWIEEMADIKGRSYKVLNGHITGLSGILDFYDITGEAKWKSLYERGVAAVKRDIPKFDAGFSSYYSLLMPSRTRPIAPLGNYNSLHVSQLLWMYEKTGDSLFLDYAMRFQSYEDNKDQFAASSSIDAVRYGPSEVRAKYGNSYWSVGVVPAWFEIVTPKKEMISGVAIDIFDVAQMPKNFTVWAEVNGVMKKVGNAPENLSKSMDIVFRQPVLTSKVKIEIPAFGEKKPVALRMAMLLRKEVLRSPVANECNHTHSKENKIFSYNVGAAYKGEEGAMSVLCDGWIVSPVTKGNTVSVSVLGDSDVTFSGSDDLAKWEPIGSNRDNGVYSAKVRYNFYKIEFKKEAARISSIKEEDKGFFSFL